MVTLPAFRTFTGPKLHKLVIDMSIELTSQWTVAFINYKHIIKYFQLIILIIIIAETLELFLAKTFTISALMVPSYVFGGM